MDQSNPFVQLVSGVVWLLRNGELYINQSLKAECDKIVDMGKKHCPYVTREKESERETHRRENMERKKR